jgi:hypothetical protein
MATDFADGSLPPFRMILWPDAGLGVEVVLRLTRWFNCFMAAEAFVHGESHVQFGLQPRCASWLRLSVAPACRLSLRVPVLRMSEFKILCAGSSVTFLSEGRVNPALTSSTSGSWKSIRQMVRPTLEIQHHPTILSTLFDDQTRQAIRDSLREVKRAREYGRDQAGPNLDYSVKPFDPHLLPPLDPRHSISESMQRAGTLRRKTLRQPDSNEGVIRPHEAQSPNVDTRRQFQNTRQGAGFAMASKLPVHLLLGEAWTSG